MNCNEGNVTPAIVCTESLYAEIAAKGRINTKVLDVSPTKAVNSADNVASVVQAAAEEL